MRSLGVLQFGLALAAGMMVHLARGADDPGMRALQQHGLQRQQRQDALQLRMLQQQQMLQVPAGAAQPKQALGRRQLEQRQLQDQLHYRQSVALAIVPSSGDAATRHAKAEMERIKARQSSLQHRDD